MRWILACDNQEIGRAISTAVSSTDSGVKLHLCRSREAAAEIAQSRPDLVLLAPDDSIDSRMAWIREIVEVASCDVLVVGHATDAKSVLHVLDAGVTRFVDIDELDASLPAALRAIAKQPSKRQQRGRIICVAGAGGGSGASTIVANLAVAMNRSKPTIAIDMRLEAGDLASLLNIHAKHSIADFCKLEGQMDSDMFENCLSVHESGVQVLTAPEKLSEIGAVTPSGVRRALCMAQQLATYVIVDLGQPHRPEHAQALHLAETIVIAMCLDFTALRQTRRVLDYLEDLQIPRDRVQIVVNRSGRPGELRPSEVESALGMRAHCLLPDDPKRIVSANNKGTPVVDMKPRSRISRGLVELARSMNGFVEN